MRKTILEVSVYTQDSEVIIEQNYPHSDPDIIVLSPEQIDIIIAWLKEAKEELNGTTT